MPKLLPRRIIDDSSPLLLQSPPLPLQTFIPASSKDQEKNSSKFL
jgi:hypothetical protein